MSSMNAFMSTQLFVMAAAVAIGITTQDTVKSIIRHIIGASGIAITLASFVSSFTKVIYIRKFIQVVGNVLHELSTWFLTIIVIYVLLSKILQRNIEIVSYSWKHFIMGQ